MIAAAGTPEKRSICIDNGAALALNYRQPGWIDAVREFTGGSGCDIIFDPVGGDTFDQALKVLAWEGRAIIIGFAGGSIQRIAVNRLLLKNASAVGAVWGSYPKRDPRRAHATVEDCFALYRENRIKPVISARYPLEEVPDALEALADRRSHGKLVINFPG